MGKGNAALHRAKKEKNDEFYTQNKDIEKELIYYYSHLKDKIVYCNCDDYRKSKLVEYFMENFDKIGLKKLISTGFSKDGQGTYSEYDGTVFKTGFLSGNGDALGEECTEILKQADVVVTNPPFSLFRKYVKQLMDYNKKFIIIGNQNAITYKEIFPYIKNNQLWLGMSMNGSSRWFVAPDSYEVKENAAGYKLDEKGRKMFFVNGVTWFTNIENKRRNEKLDLYKRYSFEDYPKYENFDAIYVNRVDEIPIDYDGVMGVPITFLYKYNPKQFEILDLINRYMIFDYFGVNEEVRKKHSHCANVNGKSTYARILIKKIQQG